MSDSINNNSSGRATEWFVPKLGPQKFRSFIGLLFLPYTAMVLAFAVIGSMAAASIFWDRVLAIVLIYFLGLGIAAHALDALGSKQTKPWGNVFTKRQLWILAAASLALAYLIAIYYMIRLVPWLATVAVLEGFFVFSYNLEWFGGRFHTDGWFAFAWGFLPVVAGYIIQTNTISAPALVLAASMALFSMVEIKASRPYKDLKRQRQSLKEAEKLLVQRYEAILKCISLAVILLGIGMLIGRAVQ
jgi:xanthine/uracil permease